MNKPSPRPPAIRTRDPKRTKSEILHAALAQFAAKGYEGAKVQQIAQIASCNPRLIYHYYENKERLYLAVLRHIYAELRTLEDALHLDALPPEQALDQLVKFTFEFFESNTAFLSITRSENLLGGRFIAQLPEIQKTSEPLLGKIADVLRRGYTTGVFRDGIDPLQLYVSIVALSAHHINASHTMTATFGEDIASENWRQQRREHVVSIIKSAVAVSVPPS